MCNTDYKCKRDPCCWNSSTEAGGFLPTSHDFFPAAQLRLWKVAFVLLCWFLFQAGGKAGAPDRAQLAIPAASHKGVLPCRCPCIRKMKSEPTPPQSTHLSNPWLQGQLLGASFVSLFSASELKGRAGQSRCPCQELSRGPVLPKALCFSCFFREPER